MPAPPDAAPTGTAAGPAATTPARATAGTSTAAETSATVETPATAADTLRSPADDEIFQYAVLRVVPSLERGEALNVGVVLHARRHRFLGARVRVDRERLRALDPELDLDALEGHLKGIVRVAEGDPGAGPVALLDRSERFGWIAAPSSTIVQPSPVHTGVCPDAEAALDRLMVQLVDRRS